MKINKLNDSNSFYTVVFKDTLDKNKGIYLTEMKTTKKGIISVETYVSTLIYIELKIRSENCIYFKVVYFDGDDKNYRFIKASDLFNDSPKENIDYSYLINNGLIVSSRCKFHLIDFLKSQSTLVTEIKGTENMGWTANDEYIGNGFSTTNDIIFTGQSSYSFKKDGNEEEYFNILTSIYTENPLVFAINCYQNSAYFLHFLKNEINQTLSLNGTTSKGKSTVGKLGLAWGTNPKNWHGLNSTKGNILSILKHSNHCPVFFDEVAESELKLEERRTLVYSLANGTERGRLHKSSDIGEFKTSSIKDKQELKYTVLIAGEESFLNGLNINGKGIEARYLEILLPQNITLWDSITTPEESESLNKFIHENYGFLSPLLIKKIKDNKEELVKKYYTKLAEVREEYIETSNVIKRKVRILAYTYVICELVAEILLKDKNEAKIMTDTAIYAFKTALLSDISFNEDDAYKELLSHIQDTLYKYLDDDNVLGNDMTLTKKFGHIKISSTHKIINIMSNSFSEVCTILKIDEKLFLSYLRSNNLLDFDKDRLTKKISINKNRASFYSIKIPLTFFNDVNEDNETADYDYEVEEEEMKKVWG